MNKKPVALITGAASGIGVTIARRFLASGYAVHVCDADATAVAELAISEPAIGATLTDVSDAAQVDALWDDVAKRYGRLDVLVNNAGIAGPTGPLEDIAPADWERTIAVDLNGAFYSTRRAIGLLKKTGTGSIINISSSAGLFGFPNRAPYAACKWALIGLSKTLAMELGPYGIRVNAICPGSVSGPRIERVIERDAAQRGVSTDAVRDMYLKQVSLRRFVSADDVAAMAAFLASDAGAMISGQAIGVDGHTEGLSAMLDDVPGGGV